MHQLSMLFVGIKPVKHGQQLCVRGKELQCMKADEMIHCRPHISVESLFEHRKCFIRAMNSVIEYVFLLFLSCIQSPHYTADMQHHIKCDHREPKPGHSSLWTAKRLTTNEAHMPSVSVK